MNNNQALQDYIFYSKYSRYNKALKRKETFKEAVNRVFDMHEKHLIKNFPHLLDGNEQSVEFFEMFSKAFDLAEEQVVLGSQRALQFGGDQILSKNLKMFNCSATYVDRIDVFKEIEYVLLCGCGVGISVQKLHIEKLPSMLGPDKEKVEFTIPDSIEGWSEAVDVLVKSYFLGEKEPVFNYSLIRPKGSSISGGFKAPGPDGLRASLEKIRAILRRVFEGSKKLRPIDAYDIVMHLADSVLSGGKY